MLMNFLSLDINTDNGGIKYKYSQCISEHVHAHTLSEINTVSGSLSMKEINI